MYTATLLGNSVNNQLRRRLVTVKFSRLYTSTDPETNEVLESVEEFIKDFQFSLNETVENIKKTVKQYLDELNAVIPDITDLDYVEPTPETPTQAELDKQAWEADFAKLKKVQELIDCGALTGTEAAIVTLRNKVKADFKPAYLG